MKGRQMCRSDRKTIEHCLNGHPDRYRHLVQRYQTPLLSYLTGRLGDLEQSEEVAQETLVRAYFSLGKLKKPDSFFPWLLGIAGRVVLEHLRSEKKRMPYPPARQEQRGNDQAPDDSSLEEAVSRLPEPYREVVLLRYYGGLTCSQLAEKLDLALGTVTKRLSRAYALLRQSIPKPGKKNSEVMS